MCLDCRRQCQSSLRRKSHLYLINLGGANALRVPLSLTYLHFDQLLHLGWAQILPLTIAYILFLTPLLYTFDLFVLVAFPFVSRLLD
jgi:hypothetical protein